VDARLVLVALGLAAAVATSAAVASPQQASRVIDRTVVCDVGLQGGVYVLNVHGEPRRRAQKRSATAYITTSVVPTGRIAYISEGFLELSPACRPSPARVSFSRRGLTAFTPSGFYGSEYDCWTPRRALLRIRAVFKSPTRLKSGSPFGFPLLFARGAVKEASFAIRTERGKQLALATVTEAGRLGIFLDTGDCFPD
jgi:hypothetical protein